MKSIQDVTVINEPALDPDLDLDVLDEIQQRILWLAIRMVDSANHDRNTGDGVKVGGHQASSASLVTALTALYFAHLDAADRVAIKPHASPVFHSIQYLLGQLDRSYLTRLRELGGLQSYPSRTKDPDNVDFSTGSVGLGPVAPLFAALTRRYVDDHFGQRDHSRFIAFMGDAELDEGNIWEAIADQATQGLGNVTWVVDFNRQSLDRVVPGVKVHQWQVQFLAAGWQVIEVKYGRKLQAKFKEANGEDLRAWIDAMPNEQYQSLFALKGEELRQRFLEGAPEGAKAAVAGVSDEDLAPLVKDLGGHDLASMLEAYRQADATTDRPTVIFAYTVKGWGLPSAGNPRNHSALMSTEQVNEMRARTQLTMATEWDRIPEDTAAGRWCNERAQHLERPRPDGHLSIAVPERVETRSPSKPISTQEGFGRIVTSLSRDEAVAKYLVTTAPDVATSTNLAGFINRAGVYSPDEIRDWNEDDPMLKWSQHPQGQHIELGISEMNLFLLLGQLGLSLDLSNQ
ncbi:MAG: pyruvate dehydrogenase, partial [Actinobacteria bacterium]|nr:pyruvate dehydrogenase [Actinomycetota bacterium]